MVGGVIEEHGFAALTMTRRSAAIHEAGHCIVYAAFGVPPIKAQIWRRFYEVDGVEKAFWGGQTLTADRELFALDPEVLELHAFFKQAAFYAAGALAEKRFDPDGLLPGSSLDERLVVSTMCRQAEDAFRLPKNAGGYVVEQIVMTLFDDFADLHAKLSSRLNNAKVIRAAELGKILAPVMEAQTSAQAKFENCVDAYLRDPVRAATTFAAAGEIVWRRRDGE